MTFPGTDYEQVIQALADKYGGVITTDGPPDGDLSVYLDGNLIGTLSYEFDHDAPGWKENYIKVDWTFKAIEK